MSGSPIAGAQVRRATKADAAELLVLQRCCWVSEAIANDTLDIPALHEDSATVVRWIEDQTVWVVRLDGRLVGSVRAALHGTVWQIGRLMVAPDLAGRGLGRWLLELAENAAPDTATTFELFTGSRSRRNITMYEAAGYVRTQQAEPAPNHIADAAYLTKGRQISALNP